MLTREEVRDILQRVRIAVYRACLTTISACGLRLTEGAHLKPSQVDGKRMLLHVHGKGGHDRYVPLPDATLVMLRDFWRTHRSPEWLFPAPTRRGLEHALAHGGGPVERSSLQSAFKRAVRASGVKKAAHVHTLRHYPAPRIIPRGCAAVPGERARAPLVAGGRGIIVVLSPLPGNVAGQGGDGCSKTSFRRSPHDD